ncbi:sensor histidine kinase [Pseudalkalibacillus berkeleyi]|uniref:histidine kinase n=1 Tax=Pseudalkalibacillus berkeleyi TaxID=1069813 RepID=A0ABS9GWS1_9BACL|nr:HAMP domain-containing sensor histidine kinase [Pseudalkalibacillus berkeleyi]MCF6136166.1 HAMP domain-containing histidine kinase [Pseudalkalibacillus berkeleyi]
MLSIAQRIWLSFFLLVFVVGLAVVIIYPLSMREALTDETYRLIEEQQNLIIQGSDPEQELPDSNLNFIERREATRSVGHLLLGNQSFILKGDVVPDVVLRRMWENASTLGEQAGEYQLTYRDASLFYVIRKIEVNGTPTFLVSYMWDTYRDQLVQKLWERLIWILIIGIIISIIPAIWLSNYLRKPLKVLGKRFEQIGSRNWKEPLQLKGDQDFELLSNQFERMRQSLIRNDQSQKMFIQHASHELKTPIMTIKSYAQSVKDGVMPEKDLEGMMNVIIHQSGRMEERVKDMIYFSKLDTLKDSEPNAEIIRFGTLLDEVLDRFRYQREDLRIHIEGEGVTFKGDRQQWEVVYENLIQNAFRYAESFIEIKAINQNGHTWMEVRNDGERIPEEDLAHIFEPFQMSHKGQFGLGLAIVKRIVELHNGNVEVQNYKDGVSITMII